MEEEGSLRSGGHVEMLGVDDGGRPVDGHAGGELRDAMIVGMAARERIEAGAEFGASPENVRSFGRDAECSREVEVEARWRPDAAKIELHGAGFGDQRLDVDAPAQADGSAALLR